MKADALLIEDHQVLRSLLAQLQESTSNQVQQRRELLDRLLFELDVHVHIEDELFYPAVREVSPLFGIAHAEHRQIDDQVGVLFRTDPAGNDFQVEARMFAETVEHHAGEEEQEMFPQSHALGEAALESLGQQMAERQRHLKGSAVTRLRLQVKRETLRRL
ncbi:MAG: hemerythrin domain-containing protein [Nakamurella sp.]